MRKYTPWTQLEQDGSLMQRQRRRWRGRLTSTPKTMNVQCREKPEARDLSQWWAWNHWQQGSTDWSAAICQLECTKCGLETERTTNIGGTQAEHYRSRCISFVTAAGGQTSRAHAGRWWKWPLDGKLADTGMCKSLRISSWNNANKRWWTSWQRQTLGSSGQNYISKM